MPTATARHILVKTKEECESLKKQIEGGADFGDLAKKHSLCPSGKSGGGPDPSSRRDPSSSSTGGAACRERLTSISRETGSSHS